MKYYLLGGALWLMSVAAWGQGSYPEASERLLTEYDLAKAGNYSWAAMRNEIFARHGFKFKKKEWSDQFMREAWYNPQFDNVDAKLSDTERKNIAFIQKCEKDGLTGFDTFWEKFRAALIKEDILTIRQYTDAEMVSIENLVASAPKYLTPCLKSKKYKRSNGFEITIDTLPACSLQLVFEKRFANAKDKGTWTLVNVVAPG